LEFESADGWRSAWERFYHPREELVKSPVLSRVSKRPQDL